MKTTDNFKGFIFDLDGTLLDSMGLWEEVYARTLESFGKKIPESYLPAINHLSVSDGAEYTVSAFGLEASPQSVVERWKSFAVDAYAHNVTLKDGAAELLEVLRAAGKKIGIATALDRGLFEPCLARCGIDGYFAAVSTVQETGRDKRFPDVYLNAAEKMGLSPSECVVAEDSFIGMQGAKKGGFFVAGVYDKSAAADVENAKQVCDVYVHGLSELTVRFR